MGNLDLRQRLEEKEKEYNFSDDIFGMSMLTNTGYVSSARALMFTSHLRQFVNLNNPDFPRVFTHNENLVGKNNTGYFKAKRDLEIVDIVSRFRDGVHDRHLYTLFYYDKKKDEYGLIEKSLVEDLTEKFGYSYDNEVMDSKDIGDTIHKGEVLYKTSSYDEDMNYCFGKNAKVMYTLENNTIEDAIVVSHSFASKMLSKEIETVTVSLNDNDILCNIYGDANNYKCFPDIGELVKDKIVCAKRRIHNSQVLFDLKKSNLRKINVNSDNLFYNSGKLIDIIIYSNKTLDELEDNVFNRQIIKYLKMQTEYYEGIYHRCKEIIHSGHKYTNDIAFMYQKACDILDDSCAWKEENHSAFSHMVIKFQFERDACVSIGSKLSGRYGNKGVVSRIWADEDMPYLANGERVDCILNALGVINRLNPAQSYETSINFICNQIRDKMRTMTKRKDKEDILFDIVGRFNSKECEKLKEYYKELSTAEKKEFFEDIDREGIYIHNPPLWEKETMFDKLRKLYRDYDWIKPIDVYVNRFGRKIKIMKPLIIGDMYMMKMKQNSKKGFSARSTGALSKKGIPEKSFKSKAHQDLYSTTPIRMGVDETQNMMIGVSADSVATLHLLYRSSVVARKDLAKSLMKFSRKAEKKVEKNIAKGKYTNRNAEILAAYMKALGVRIVFPGDTLDVDIDVGNYDTFTAKDGSMFIGTATEFKDECLRQEILEDYTYDKCFVGTDDEFKRTVDREFRERKHSNVGLYIDIDTGEE